jgi:hypothetical protein
LTAYANPEYHNYRGPEEKVKICNFKLWFDLVDHGNNFTRRPNAGLEIVGCQWPKAGHILEMAGNNKFELPSKKNGR